MDASRHDLVPFFIALEHIYRQVYVARTSGMAPRSPGALDGLAHAVANLTTLWIYSPDGRSVRELSGPELAHGLFRGGGRTLYFVDHRAPIENLAMRASAVAQVVATLIEGFPVDDRPRSGTGADGR